MSRNQIDFFAKLRAILQQPLPQAAPKALPRLQSARELQENARQLFTSLGYVDLASQVTVRWNPKMRSTAGLAYPTKALVVLNPRLQEFGDAEIDRTLRHELAHILAHYRAGRRKIAAHGPEWRRACIDLGLSDEKRCHDLPLPRRVMNRQHAYRCPNCATVIRRVRPIKRASACLACCRAYSSGRFDERFRLVRIENANLENRE